MYYTGLDPRTMKPVYVAKTPREKAMQRALLQWRRPDKRQLVLEGCLVKPPPGWAPAKQSAKDSASAKRGAPSAKHTPSKPKGWAKAKKKR